MPSVADKNEATAGWETRRGTVADPTVALRLEILRAHSGDASAIQRLKIQGQQIHNQGVALENEGKRTQNANLVLKGRLMQTSGKMDPSDRLASAAYISQSHGKDALGNPTYNPAMWHNYVLLARKYGEVVPEIDGFGNPVVGTEASGIGPHTLPSATPAPADHLSNKINGVTRQPWMSDTVVSQATKDISTTGSKPFMDMYRSSDPLKKKNMGQLYQMITGKKISMGK
jgi:hypothetical protein